MPSSATEAAGYSGTPLWKKLGLKEGQAAAAINAPEGYHDVLLDGAPAADWAPPRTGVDFIHFFTVHRAEMEDLLPELMALMARDGMIWVSWPKRAAKVPTDMTEDVIREVALPLGLVDVKVCAVDDIWSGLKLVIRKELR